MSLPYGGGSHKRVITFQNPCNLSPFITFRNKISKQRYIIKKKFFPTGHENRIKSRAFCPVSADILGRDYYTIVVLLFIRIRTYIIYFLIFHRIVFRRRNIMCYAFSQRGTIVSTHTHTQGVFWHNNKNPLAQGGSCKTRAATCPPSPPGSTLCTRSLPLVHTPKNSPEPLASGNICHVPVSPLPSRKIE